MLVHEDRSLDDFPATLIKGYPLDGSKGHFLSLERASGARSHRHVSRPGAPSGFFLFSACVFGFYLIYFGFSIFTWVFSRVLRKNKIVFSGSNVFPLEA